MDPVTLGVLSGIGGSVAKDVIDKVWGNAEKWLNSYFKDHQPKAQESAKENSLDFLLELGNRITDLEKSFEDESKAKKQFLNALSNPDFSAVLHDSIIASARTSSKMKHNLLASVISDKLVQEPESRRSLAVNKAVEIIPYLSSNHLKIIGIFVLIKFLRPENIPKSLPNEVKCEYHIKWLSKKLSLFMPIKVDEVEIAYLIGLSIFIVRTETKDIRDVLFSTPNDPTLKCNTEYFFNSEIGKELLILWKNIKNLNSGYLGTLIGSYVYDEISGTKTQLPDYF